MPGKEARINAKSSSENLQSQERHRHQEESGAPETEITTAHIVRKKRGCPTPPFFFLFLLSLKEKNGRDPEASLDGTPAGKTSFRKGGSPRSLLSEDLVHTRPARLAFPLHGRTAVLHGDFLGIRHISLGPAFHAISLHSDFTSSPRNCYHDSLKSCLAPKNIRFDKGRAGVPPCQAARPCTNLTLPPARLYSQ